MGDPLWSLVSVPGVVLSLVLTAIVTHLITVRTVNQRRDRERDLQTEAWEKERKLLHSLVETDYLSGLPNTRSLDRQLVQMVANALRSGQPLAVVFMDGVGFGKINKLYGDPIGDRMIKALGAALSDQRRAGDTIGRKGGDEFLALLPSTDASQALVFAARMASNVGYVQVRLDGGSQPLLMSLTMGIAVLEVQDGEARVAGHTWVLNEHRNALLLDEIAATLMRVADEQQRRAKSQKDETHAHSVVSVGGDVRRLPAR